MIYNEFHIKCAFILDVFQNAKEKLKDAEKISDLNSEEELPIRRKRRQERAAKFIPSSDTSDDEKALSDCSTIENYPVPPIKGSSVGCATKRMKIQEFSHTGSFASRQNSSPQRNFTSLPSCSKSLKRTNENIVDINVTKNILPQKSTERILTDSDISIGGRKITTDLTDGYNLTRSITGLKNHLSYDGMCCTSVNLCRFGLVMYIALFLILEFFFVLYIFYSLLI